MSSLKAHKALLIPLMEQNELLKAEYKKAIQDINEKVSDTLAKSEQFLQMIGKLEKDKISGRRKMVRQFGVLMLECEQKRKGLGFLTRT